jgi:hypothetical protein
MRVVILCLCLFILNSCQVQRTNDREDKKRAEKLTNDFYTEVIQGHLEKVSKLFGSEATPEGAIKTFSQIDSLAGKLIRYTITNVETNVITKNGQTTGSYQITVDCTYEKGKMEEVLIFLIDGEKYIINGYHSTMKL